jgi:putative permease
MIEVVRSWFDRYFSEEEAVVLFALLLVGFGIVIIWGDILAPVIGAVIFAFILQGLVGFLTSKGLGRLLSVWVAFGLFVSGITALMFGVMPLVYRQTSALILDLPRIFTRLETYSVELREKYPSVIRVEDLDNLYKQLSSESAGFVQWVFSHSLETLPVLVSILIYFIVVPLLVFFFLKDKEQIFDFIRARLPSNRGVITRVAREMDLQFANYLRGKFVEILLVGFATYVGFLVFGLNYAVLLSILVGLSVVIPYIGAVVVTIPVVIIALFQFGFTNQFYYVVAVYLIIQGLDGNVLVPLLFSEVVNLHPTIIIISVLFFGGIWGFWGVFFAIPLATFVKAVFNAWPTKQSLVRPSIEL